MLEMALSSWRAHMDVEGPSLEHSLKLVLHLRFADDVLIFFILSLDKAWFSFDELGSSLAK